MNNIGYFYTKEKIANCRNNIEKYDWAKAQCEKTVKAADAYLEKYSLDALWMLPSSQSMYRSYGVNQKHGCLVCGHSIDRFGNYPYKMIDGQPLWKIECPHCHTVFPSNDFESYYNSALDENGYFCPEKGDRSLLKNTLYPEKGENWAVDDGYGYIADDGKKYTFVCYFTHWFLWNNIIRNILVTMGDAFLFTGEQKYADAGLVLINRVAELYPTLSGEGHDRNKGYQQSDGGSGRGKVLGCIWETGFAHTLAACFDAYKGGLASMSRDALDVIAKNSRGRQSTAEEVSDNIDENLLREIYRGVRRREISGNNGMHQQTLALAAVVLDDAETTREWIDYLFDPAIITEKESLGANMAATFVNQIDRDGFGLEASPGYNSGWLAHFIGAAEVLKNIERRPADKYIYNIYENVKFKKMFYSMIKLIMSKEYTPQIGDVGACGNPGKMVSASTLLPAYLTYRDPYLAQAIYFLNGNTTEGLRVGIYEEDIEHIRQEIEEIVKEKGEIVLSDVNLAGYGYSSLKHMNEEGNDNPETSFGVYYGLNRGHGHIDTLNMYMYAYNMNVLPDLGYPEFCDSADMHRRYWVDATLSHNLVIVDKMNQEILRAGTPTHYFADGDVKMVSVEAPEAYKQTSEYKRTDALVRIDGNDSYTVDFFRVKGGKEHAFSFHFGETESLKTKGVELVPQTDENGYMTGTLLGKEIEFAAVNDPSGYQYLYNVQKDTALTGNASFDGRICDTWKRGTRSDVHVKFTFLTEVEELVLAQGVPPRNKPGNPKYLDYIYAYNRDENEAESLFVSVIEPYAGESKIESIERIPVYDENGKELDKNGFAAVKITLKNGRVDTVIYCSDKDISVEADSVNGFRGFMCIRTENGDGSVSIKTFDATSLFGEAKTGCYEGKIADFTRTLSDKNHIDVTFDTDADISCLCGKIIHIPLPENTGNGFYGYNAVFNILSAEKLENGNVRLDIGDITTIRCYRDSAKKDMTPVYYFKEGDSFRIPLDR